MEQIEIEELAPFTHTISAKILLRIKQGAFHESPFSDAALIVALRQDIFIANMVQRPVEPIANHCNIDFSLQPASHAMWTYRIIAHAARVTNFAYEACTKDSQRWDNLAQYANDWTLRRPDSFLPVYQAMTCSPHSRFPELRFASDCAVAAHQYHLLCQILLLAHNPRAPVLGPGRTDFILSRDEAIRAKVRSICGSALAHPEYEPAKLTASLVIAMCGELFNDPSETQELLALLSEAELHLGGSSLKAVDKLRAFWKLT